MTWTTTINVPPGSLTITGAGEHVGTAATIPDSDLAGMSESDREAHIERVFLATHQGRISAANGVGWRRRV